MFTQPRYHRGGPLLPIRGGESNAPIITDIDEAPDQTVIVNVSDPTPEADPVPVIPIPANTNAFDHRVLSIETRLGVVEGHLTDLRAAVESRAETGHSHPLPPSVEALAEHLDSIESEEVLPAPRASRGKKLLDRKLWGN